MVLVVIRIIVAMVMLIMIPMTMTMTKPSFVPVMSPLNNHFILFVQPSPRNRSMASQDGPSAGQHALDLHVSPYRGEPSARNICDARERNSLGLGAASELRGTQSHEASNSWSERLFRTGHWLYIYLRFIIIIIFLNFMNRIKGLMVVELLTMSAGEIRDFLKFRFYKKLEKTWVLIMIPWCKNLLFWLQVNL